MTHNSSNLTCEEYQWQNFTTIYVYESINIHVRYPEETSKKSWFWVSNDVETVVWVTSDDRGRRRQVVEGVLRRADQCVGGNQLSQFSPESYFTLTTRVIVPRAYLTLNSYSWRRRSALVLRAWSGIKTKQNIRNSIYICSLTRN